MTRKTTKKSPTTAVNSASPAEHITSPSAGLAALVNAFAAAAQSRATQRSYDADLRHFESHGGTIPASAEMIAAYLANCAGTTAVATLQHRLIAIHRAHTDQGIPSPVMERLVKRTMQGIRRTFGTAQRRIRALVKDGLLDHTRPLYPAGSQAKDPQSVITAIFRLKNRSGFLPVLS